MVIKHDGKIGIGTGAPKHTLEVNGGIVETGGVIKSNLLVNSGFDVWSQSTLENVATIAEDDCADNSLGGWGSQIRASVAFDTDHYEYSTSGGYNEVMMQPLSVTAGKLYKISVDVKSGTGSTTTLQLKLYDGAAHYSNDTGRLPLISTTGSFVTHTYVMEAANNLSTASFGLFDQVAFANNIEFKNFIVTEVSPGMVAGSAAKAPDGWSKQGSAREHLTREHWNGSGGNSDTTKTGSFYSLKITKTSASNGGVIQYLGWVDQGTNKRVAGRTVTFGCWIKTDTASFIDLYITDGIATSYSTAHTGNNTWQWLEITRTMSASAGDSHVGIRTVGNNTKVAYASQPIVVLGSAIGEGNYTRQKGEIIWFENKITSQMPTSISSQEDVNVEADSNGKIPKGAAAVDIIYAGSNAVVEKYLLVENTALIQHSQVANVRVSQAGWVPLGSDTNLSFTPDGTWNEIFMQYHGVQLQ
jgi:hypothetical protein